MQLTGSLRRAKPVVPLVAALALVGCGGGDEPRYSYPEEARKNFLTGCSTGASEGQCECLLGELQETVPFEEFEELDTTIRENGINGLSTEQRELFERAGEPCTDA